MPYTVRTRKMYVKNANGTYNGFDAFADQSTEQMIESLIVVTEQQKAAIEEKGTETQEEIYADIKTYIAFPYSDQTTYLEGSYCITDNGLWKCIEPVTTPEAFDESKWKNVSVGSEMQKYIANISKADILSLLE